MTTKVHWCDRRIAAPGPYLALCLTEAQFVAACKKIKVVPPLFIKNEWSDATAHYFEASHGLTVLVCLRGWMSRKQIEIAGLLVHEAVHVWQVYAERLGEQNPGSEQEAYAIQAIAQELMQSFADQTGAKA